MNKRIALLLYRVARWLAPEYFSNRLRTIAEMRVRIGVLRERVCAMPRRRLHGREGRFVIDELQSLEGIYKTAAAYYDNYYIDRDRYELLKIEVPRDTVLKRTHLQRGETAEEVLRVNNKRKLFEAVAAGLAQSAEIEKFMYVREYGHVNVVGIQVYLKHAAPSDAHRTVGNYAKQYNTKHSDGQ